MQKEKRKSGVFNDADTSKSRTLVRAVCLFVFVKSRAIVLPHVDACTRERGVRACRSMEVSSGVRVKRAVFSRAPRAGGTLFHDPHKARQLTLLTARARMGAGLNELLAALWDPTCPLQQPLGGPTCPSDIRYLHIPVCTCMYLHITIHHTYV